MSKVYNEFFTEEIWEKVNQNSRELLSDFLLELKQRQRAKSTIVAYQHDIKGFLCDVYRMFDNVSVLELSKRDLRKYSIYLKETCLVSNARHNRIFSALRSMLAYAEEESDEYEYERNVAEKISGLPKDKVREIVFLSDDQIRKILDVLVEQEKYQDATLLSLSYESGARKGELAQVEKYSFIEGNHNSTNRVIGKGRKEFSLLYFDRTKQYAQMWLNQRGTDDIDSMWVVGSGENKHAATKKNIYDMFVRMRDILASFDDEERLEFNVHSLRHSCLQSLSDGTHWLCQERNHGEKFDIDKLRLIANHESVSTTQSYLRDTSTEELEELFDIKID